MNVVKHIRSDPGFVDTRVSTGGNDATLGAIGYGTAGRRIIGLGDVVEYFAKPIGCVIDRLTGSAPEWLIKPKPFVGIRLVKAVKLSWLTRLMNRMPRGRYWPLPHGLRTGFCKGTCGCSRRKSTLNLLVPDICSASAWKGACKTVSRRLLLGRKTP